MIVRHNISRFPFEAASRLQIHTSITTTTYKTSACLVQRFCRTWKIPTVLRDVCISRFNNFRAALNKGRRDMSFTFPVYSVLPEKPDEVVLGSAEQHYRNNDRYILRWSVTQSIKDMSPNSSLYRLTFYAALHENTCNLQASIKN